MKKILFIILILLPIELFSQQNYCIIFSKDSTILKQYKINWHRGIDPVKTVSGDWVIPEKVIQNIPSNIKIFDPLIDDKEVISDLREYLISRSKILLDESDFPITISLQD